MAAPPDFRIRQEAFQWIEAQRAICGDALPRGVLQDGFVLEGERIRLVGPQGIFKPKCMELPLSITTIPSGPYADSITGEGLLLYRYRGKNPNHHENVGLRRAMTQIVPLVYFMKRMWDVEDV